MEKLKGGGTCREGARPLSTTSSIRISGQDTMRDSWFHFG